MAGNHLYPTRPMQDNYRRFVAELTRISRRYGVAVKSVGGVFIARNPSDLTELVYVGDVHSGDLLPLWGELDVSL